MRYIYAIFVPILIAILGYIWHNKGNMEKSNYGKFLAERESTEILEHSLGFATYKFTEKWCYIINIFVEAGARKTGLATEMADKIAVFAAEKGYKYLLGSVNLQDPNATSNMKVLLAYDMKVLYANEQLIYFEKLII